MATEIESTIKIASTTVTAHIDVVPIGNGVKVTVYKDLIYGVSKEKDG